MLLTANRLPFENYIRLSEFLPAFVDESNLNLTNNQPRTSYHRYAQDAVNEAASQGIPLVWDKKIAINDTIVVKSNTHVYAPLGNGAILSAGVNKPMFINENVIFRENSRIIDENITIDGGVWNGNGMNQTRKNNEFGLVNIFSWMGVKNLNLRNHKMYTPKVYCQQAINIKDGVVEDFIVDVGRNGAINMDGVHFDGWCNDCRVSRGRINAYDDGVGCNADDLYYSSSYAEGGALSASFFYEDPCGPANNITFEDLHFDNSLFGVRILSSRSRVDNITIKNFTGVTRDYAVLIDNYWRNPTAIQGAGVGDIGTINVDNIDMIVNRGLFGDTQDATISLSCSVENLIMTNIIPNTGNVPTLAKYSPAESGYRAYRYGNLVLNGVIV